MMTLVTKQLFISSLLSTIKICVKYIKLYGQRPVEPGTLISLTKCVGVCVCKVLYVMVYYFAELNISVI